MSIRSVRETAQNWSFCVGALRYDGASVSRKYSALGSLALWKTSRAAWRSLVTAAARDPPFCAAAGPVALVMW